MGIVRDRVLKTVAKEEDDLGRAMGQNDPATIERLLKGTVAVYGDNRCSGVDSAGI